jgi:hypothetical protein
MVVGGMEISTEEQSIGGARRHHAKFGMSALMRGGRFDARIPNLGSSGISGKGCTDF